MYHKLSKIMAKKTRKTEMKNLRVPEAARTP